MNTLTELLPAGSMIINVEPERVRARAEDLVATNEEFLAAAWDTSAEADAVAPIDLGQLRMSDSGSAPSTKPPHGTRKTNSG